MPNKRSQKNIPKKKGGRPRNPRRIAEDTLLKAIEKVQAEKGTGLLEHFVKRAYASENVLIAIMRKLIPDMQKGTPVVDQSSHRHYTIEVKKVYDRKAKNRLLTASEPDKGVGVKEKV